MLLAGMMQLEKSRLVQAMTWVTSSNCQTQSNSVKGLLQGSAAEPVLLQHQLLQAPGLTNTPVAVSTQTACMLDQHQGA